MRFTIQEVHHRQGSSPSRNLQRTGQMDRRQPLHYSTRATARAGIMEVAVGVVVVVADSIGS